MSSARWRCLSRPAAIAVSGRRDCRCGRVLRRRSPGMRWRRGMEYDSVPLCRLLPYSMRRPALKLIAAMVFSSGCHSAAAPRSCMVNEDCEQGENSQQQYCDGQTVVAYNFLSNSLSCYQGQRGTCKPIDDSTFGATCSTNDDCKSYTLACMDQVCADVCLATISNNVVLCDDFNPCPSPDALPPMVGIVRCPAGCRAGKRNWTCGDECFCLVCPVPDGGRGASDATRPATDAANMADARRDVSDGE
jgi:hypothetical protein